MDLHEVSSYPMKTVYENCLNGMENVSNDISSVDSLPNIPFTKPIKSKLKAVINNRREKNNIDQISKQVKALLKGRNLTKGKERDDQRKLGMLTNQSQILNHQLILEFISIKSPTMCQHLRQHHHCLTQVSMI